MNNYQAILETSIGSLSYRATTNIPSETLQLAILKFSRNPKLANAEVRSARVKGKFANFNYSAEDLKIVMEKVSI